MKASFILVGPSDKKFIAIRLAEQERESSIRLRGIIGSTLSNTSQEGEITYNKCP